MSGRCWTFSVIMLALMTRVFVFIAPWDRIRYDVGRHVANVQATNTYDALAEQRARPHG
jgi:hypothetical protein